MNLAVININDAGLQVGLDGELVRTSPGIAVLHDNRLITGEEAGQNLKLLPRWTNIRFWSQLNTNSLANGTDQVRHHADIAFSHLEDLWTPVSSDASDVLFVVPGYYDKSQLGLLLGMARECNIPVKGIVDHSIAAASELSLRQNVLHLDAHLHNFTLTKLSNEHVLSRGQVATILETGLFTVWDRWANIIASQFIQATRFDPMHNAVTEQALFNLIPAWIRSLSGTNMHSFTLATADAEHNVAISHESLLKACATIYPQIVQAVRREATDPTSLLLSPHLLNFPGLKESLQLLPNVDIIELDESAAVDAASNQREAIIDTSGSINHVVSLSTANGPTQSASPAKASTATHLLWHNSATPIGSSFPLDADLSGGPRRSSNPACTFYHRNSELLVEPHNEGGISLKGEEIREATALQPGDVVSVSGESLTVISVLS